MAQSTIRVRRPTERANKRRAYQLLANGVRQGEVRDGEEARFELPAGEYDLTAKIDWASSNTLHVNLQEGSETNLEVGSSLRGWRLLLGLAYVTVYRDRYLYLRQV